MMLKELKQNHLEYAEQLKRESEDCFRDSDLGENLVNGLSKKPDKSNVLPDYLTNLRKGFEKLLAAIYLKKGFNVYAINGVRGIKKFENINLTQIDESRAVKFYDMIEESKKIGVDSEDIKLLHIIRRLANPPSHAALIIDWKTKGREYSNIKKEIKNLKNRLLNIYNSTEQ